MRSTKKILLVALMIAVAISLFAVGAVANAADAFAKPTAPPAVVISASAPSLAPDGTATASISTPVDFPATTGDTARFAGYDVFLGYNPDPTATTTTKSAVAAGSLAVTIGADNSVVGIPTSISTKGISNKKVYAPGTYQFFFEPKPITAPITATGPAFESATFVITAPLTSNIITDATVVPATYTQGSATPVTITPTYTTAGLTAVQNIFTITSATASIAGENWGYVPTAATPLVSGALSLASTEQGNAGPKDVKVTVAYTTTTLAGVDNTASVSVLSTTQLTLIPINKVDISYTYAAGTKLVPMDRITSGDFDHVAITIKNNTGAAITADLWIYDSAVGKNTDAEAKIFDDVSVAANSSKTVKFYGLINKKVLDAKPTYKIYAADVKDTAAITSVSEPANVIDIYQPLYPITSDNVSWSPSTYVPGGAKMTATITPNSLISVTGTKILKVVGDNGSGSDETPSWTFADTDPANALTHTMANTAATEEKKMAFFQVKYPVLTLGAGATKTTADSAFLPLAGIPVSFTVGSKTPAITVTAGPADTINKIIVPETSGKGLTFKVTANVAGIACAIDLIPVGKTEPVMRWTWTSTNDTKSYEVKDWNCVTATYPTKSVVPVGKYKLVVNGATQSIVNNAVVTNPVASASADVAVGSLINPTGLVFSPNTAEVAKGLTCDASKLLVFTPADTTSATTDKTVTYSSDKPTVAYVDASTGIVTGVAEGEATITATSKVSYPYISATLKVTVKAPSTKVELPAQVRALVGETFQITAKFDGPAYPMTYASSDEKVATVDDKGLVKIVKESVVSDGVVITVTCKDLIIDGKAFEAKIPVIGAVKATGLLLMPGETLTITAGIYEISKKVAAYIEPKNALENVANAVTYASSDESVVYVKDNGGLIIAKPGVAVITVKGAGFEKTITVTVKLPGTVAAPVEEAPAADAE